jgi:hypothetical protein
MVANPVTTRFEATITARNATIPSPTVRMILNPRTNSPGPSGSTGFRASSMTQTSPRIGGSKIAVNLHDITSPPIAAVAQR